MYRSDLEETPRTAAAEIRSNFIKSVILIVFLAAVVIGLSLLIGERMHDRQTGLIVGLAVTLVVIPIQVLTAKFVMLGMTTGRAADPDSPRDESAIRILEELSASAGLRRTPSLYIIPSDVPNAFASGLGEWDAFVAVTTGLLDTMDDQQLEGVIGHEIGHIVHRDILLNQLVIGLISSSLILTFIFRLLSAESRPSAERSRYSNRRSFGGYLIVLLASFLISFLVNLVSRLLQTAISRKREFAADAYSVQVCGSGEGLAQALEKLDHDDMPFTAEEKASLGGSHLAAMYINYPAGYLFPTHPPVVLPFSRQLFSTHPPIAERVRRIRNTF